MSNVLIIYAIQLLHVCETHFPSLSTYCLWVLRFPQWCSPGFHFSWIWVNGWSDPSISRQCSDLIFSGQNVQADIL